MASAFFLKNENHNPSENITREGKKIFIKNGAGIFSWYDPFLLYELHDGENSFQLEQITNGSVYVSYENDGAIMIYSIDLVANLGFLANGEKMTEMIIFPGMSVRFDPSKNAELKNADLLKIAQILADEKNARAKTGIEFQYPRIENSITKTSTFGLPLPPNSERRALFQYFEYAVLERVKTLDAMKQYSDGGNGGFVQLDSEQNILNPTKNMYRLLGELQIIFSDAVNSKIDADMFRKKVLDIRTRASEFELENRVDELLQKFLIDGRFALYADGTEALQYKKLYNEAALILGIVPEDGKGKFFQSLSDIFSKSVIFSDKTNLTTIAETTNALKKMLDQKEIVAKDYFDISLYSFSIFQKNLSWDEKSSKNILTRSLLENSMIYDLYATIFQ